MWYVPFVLYGLKYCIYVLHILRTYFWHELNVWILVCQVIPELSAPTSNAKVETNFPIGRRPPFSLQPLSLFFYLLSLSVLLLLFSSLLSPLSPFVSISPSFPLYNLTSPSFLVSLFFSFQSLFFQPPLCFIWFLPPSSYSPFSNCFLPFCLLPLFLLELSLCLSLSLHHSFSFILSYLSFWLHGIMRVCDTELV